MALRSGRKYLRFQFGLTITELLITCLIMGLTMAVIGELVVLNTFAIWKTTNKSDSENSARWTIERISADVRKARCVGDHYAASPSHLNQFPSDNGNPLYFGSAPIGGWPWNGPPYYLGQNCLILQLPVFFENATNQLDPRNGFPSMIPTQALGAGLPGTNVENLETVIYQIVQDPQTTDEFMLQIVRLPGAAIYNSTSGPPYALEAGAALPITVNNPPQTLLRGIIGPLTNGNATPSIFSYYTKSSGSAPTLVPQTSVVQFSLVPQITGVAIDLEVKKPLPEGPVALNSAYQETIAVHAEAAMRYNTKLQLTNFAQTAK